MFLNPFEWTIAKRYLWPGKGEGFIKLVAGISIGVVMLSVAMLVIVMSVMNGFRAELLDKIVGLNGHAIVQAYGGRLDDWKSVLTDIRESDGVVSASPLIEQPLLVTFDGRVEAVLVRGNTQEDIDALQDKTLMGSMAEIKPGADKVAIGSRLAENIGRGQKDADIITKSLVVFVGQQGLPQGGFRRGQVLGQFGRAQERNVGAGLAGLGGNVFVIGGNEHIVHRPG
mgnify:CR=1 FL=1